MQVSILHDDDTENELDLKICCSRCALDDYQWNSDQYNKIKAFFQNSKVSAIKIPSSVDNDAKLAKYLKDNISKLDAHQTAFNYG